MKVLVTGGGGFTGEKLAMKLFRMGLDVRVFVRRSDQVKKDSDYNPEVLTGDIRDRDAVFKAVKGVDKVFNIAAFYRSGNTDEKIYWGVHVEGVRHIMEAASAFKVSRVIHCSTVGVHGHIEGNAADENAYFKPGDIYQLTKLNGELLAHRLAGQTGTPLTVIRPTAIYGPGDMRLLKLFKLANRNITAFPGNGKIRYHMIYVDDLVEAFILASDSDAAIGESFIIGSDECLTLNELIDCMGNSLSVNPFKIRLPAVPFQIAGSVCESVFGVFGISPPIYRRRVDFFTKSRFFDTRKSKELLGFLPNVTMAAGIERTAKWYIENGMINEGKQKKKY